MLDCPIQQGFPTRMVFLEATGSMYSTNRACTCTTGSFRIVAGVASCSGQPSGPPSTRPTPPPQATFKPTASTPITKENPANSDYSCECSINTMACTTVCVHVVARDRASGRAQLNQLPACGLNPELPSVAHLRPRMYLLPRFWGLLRTCCLVFDQWCNGSHVPDGCD